ncbi:hypothetical protein Syun_020031 [Stephania yunnanensis]|uniref:Uncharacterized protein n=1 Tax=Stephania yunnanensis TaxID=152371 RepID=A0AAP0IVA1_9MAGN
METREEHPASNHHLLHKFTVSRSFKDVMYLIARKQNTYLTACKVFSLFGVRIHFKQQQQQHSLSPKLIGVGVRIHLKVGNTRHEMYTSNFLVVYVAAGRRNLA